MSQSGPGCGADTRRATVLSGLDRWDDRLDDRLDDCLDGLARRLDGLARRLDGLARRLV